MRGRGSRRDRLEWSILAVIAAKTLHSGGRVFHVAYGLLASISGANSSGSSGYGGGSADGTVTWSVTELAPAWFTFSTGLMGVLFLAAAAIANVAVLGDIRARARSHSQDERSRAVGT